MKETINRACYENRLLSKCVPIYKHLRNHIIDATLVGSRNHKAWEIKVPNNQYFAARKLIIDMEDAARGINKNKNKKG